MNKNPYDILGVSENATDDQIKSAYRELAKKYHPDSYEDSPLKDLAKEKMQEINEAYDEIQRLRREGKKYSGNTSSYSSGYTKTNYPEVRNYIKNGRFDDAETILRGIPVTARDAEWHFLYGMINYRRGWTDQAYTYFRTACDMDPANPEFRSVFNRVNSQRTYRSPEYNTTYNTTGGGCSSCDMCSALCCADVCCECMGGDLISCC